MSKNERLKRMVITKTVGEISCSDLDGKICDAIELLTKCFNKYGPEAKLSYTSRLHYYEDSPSYAFNVEVDVIETDDEFNERKAAIKESDKKKKERDIAELERLIKIYGVQEVSSPRMPFIK